MLEKLKIKAIYDDFLMNVHLTKEQIKILDMLLDRNKVIKIAMEIGVSEETDKSFHYMVKALEDFIKVLEQEADTQQQKQELRMALQNSMRQYGISIL